MQTHHTPRSPYQMLGGLVFLARTIDKIRLKAAGTLRPDFLELMGKGFDARIMGYLEINYNDFATFVLTGADDDACWTWCESHGRKMDDLSRLIWNDFASKRGWRDAATEILLRFKTEGSYSNRDDIQTLFEYMEVDEGRKP